MVSHEVRWLQVPNQRHNDGIFKTLRELVSELRKNTGKQANSPLDLIILKRETAEWFIALTGTGRSGNPLIYFFGCEQGDEEGATQNPLGPEGQCAPSTTRHSSALGLNCTLGQSRAWHLGVRFRWGLCFMDTWGNDHLPREKHGGISFQKQRLMTTQFFSLQIITLLRCLWKSCPKLYSLSVNCQKSKEPNQWKVSLGEVFIPEASKRLEHRHARSSSCGRTVMTMMMMCEHQPTKRRLHRLGADSR